MNPLIAILIAVILVLLNGIFVAAEFALIAARRTRIEREAEEGDRGARRVLNAMQNLPLSLSGAQLGITVTSLGLGLIAEPAVADVLESIVEPLIDIPSGLLHGISFAVALLVVVFFHMVIGEMVPKNLALATPERTARWVTPVHWALVTIMRPVVWLLNGMAALLLKPFRVEQVEELGTAHTAQEFVTMLDASAGEGVIDEFNHMLLSGALGFESRDAASLMVPWSDVVMADRTDTVVEVSELAATSGHSRIPIIAGSAVLGFVHAKDLLYVENGDRDKPVSRELIRRMLVVSSDRKVSELLFSMRRSQIHFALVRNHGNEVGIITLEDILELIVGDIIDETDRIRARERVR